jgi:hypothetical protein
MTELFYDPVFEFDDARRNALKVDLARLRRGLPADLLPFDAVREKLRLRHTVDRGIEDVPLDRIVGSLGRDRDFNRLFFPRGESLRGRWEGVRKLAEGDRGFPTVELYKVGDAYFVLDGHHRVSVARHLQSPTIEAHVLEFVTDVVVAPDDSLEALALRRGRADFLEATGIDVDATEPDAYERLLDHISVHGWYSKKPWRDAVASWRAHVYEPTLDLVRASGVMAQFPGRTETDLYLYAMDHLYFLREREGEDANTNAAVSEMQHETARPNWRERWRRWSPFGDR